MLRTKKNLMDLLATENARVFERPRQLNILRCFKRHDKAVHLISRVKYLCSVVDGVINKADDG